jgi:hypothetical protein
MVGGSKQLRRSTSTGVIIGTSVEDVRALSLSLFFRMICVRLGGYEENYSGIIIASKRLHLWID